LRQLHPSLPAGLPSHRKKVNANPLQRNEEDAVSAMTVGAASRFSSAGAVWRRSAQPLPSAAGKFAIHGGQGSAKFSEHASPEMKKLM
jgi:hypothetical protein